MVKFYFLNAFLCFVILGITENHGSSMKALLSVCLYIRDMADYLQINNIYSKYFDLNPPTRVCVQAPIKCYAMIEAIATLSVDRKRSMHVQSISHWAPANIGPYSQCVQVICGTHSTHLHLLVKYYQINGFYKCLGGRCFHDFRTDRFNPWFNDFTKPCQLRCRVSPCTPSCSSCSQRHGYRNISKTCRTSMHIHITYQVVFLKWKTPS